MEEKMTHDELIQRIEELERKNEELRRGKRYGLIWEDQEEEVEKQLKGNYPVLTEVKEREILVDKSKPTNLLIEGDNLHSLQTLLYTHREKVNVIYIDPPYNTGNKDFIYNDKMVDKEDTWRHSKWLSFMAKRLRIARELLSDDGVIFISIDDNEQAQLKLLCDEIFGEDNFLLNISVNRPSEIATNSTIMKHEYALVYVKNKNLFYKRKNNLSRYVISRGTVGNEKQTMPKIEFPAGLNCYGIPDGIYTNTRIIEGSKENIENFTDIEVENGKLKHPIILKGRWRSSNDMRNFFKNNCRPTKAKISGEIVEIYFNSDKFNPQIKKATSNKLSSLYLENKKGSIDLSNIGIEFTYPKSKDLILNILKEINSKKDDIILDFFAGSGTTGHAVMELNKKDGGNRQFILCTNNEIGEKKEKEFEKVYGKKTDFPNEWEAWGDKYGISRTVTYERLKRVINGYTTPKGKAVDGLGGNLKYYKTDIIYKTDDVNDMKYELLDKSLDLLSIKENTFELIEDSDMFKLFRGQDKLMGVYLDNYPDYPLLSSIKEKMTEDGIEKKLLYVAEGTDIDNDEKINELKSAGIKVKKIPNKIMQILEGK